MNYAVYISGKGTRLFKLINGKNEIIKRIKVVISDDKQNQYMEKTLRAIGIKYYILDFSNIPVARNEKNIFLSNWILEILQREKIDYCFSFGAHILKGELLKKYQYKLINFHPGLMPDVKGLNAIDKAVKEKKNLLGNTVHFIDEGVDTGPIILQTVTCMRNFEDNGYDSVLDQQLELLRIVDQLLLSDRIHVRDGKVNIVGANYYQTNMYPYIDVCD